MNVASAVCAVRSSTTSWAARGVAPLAADAKACTMVEIENVVTASMLAAMMPRIRSTASAPIWLDTASGMKRSRNSALNAVPSPSRQ